VSCEIGVALFNGESSLNYSVFAWKHKNAVSAVVHEIKALRSKGGGVGIGNFLAGDLFAAAVIGNNGQPALQAKEPPQLHCLFT
jgi:hypothetical protein